MDRVKIMRLKYYIKNYWKLKNADSRRSSFLQGIAQHLVIQ